MKNNFSDVGDYSKLCRVCGKNNNTLIDLFSHEATQNNLVQKVNKYLPIVVEIHDKLPLGICQPCATAVLNWHSLVQCCERTDKLLILKLKQTSQLQNNKDPNYKPNGETSTRDENPNERLSSIYLILILKEVLNDYFKILDVNEENSDLLYVCQMCPEHPASTSIECLCDHLKTCHNGELYDKSAIETFVKENITFEEVLNNDGVSDTESEKHVTEIRNYYCPCCESVFSSPTRLICHLNKHVDVSINDGVLCCNNLYSDKKSFVLHLQEKHVNKTTESALICKTCGSTEENTEALEIHINEKHSDVEYQKKKIEPNPKCQKFIPAVCPECNKTFSNKYNMLKHMESHSGVAGSKFMCNKCNKTYKNRGSLTHHQKVFHEGLLPFLCSMCGEGFPSRMARDTHARIHTGFKPFSCKYCNKSYRAQNTLNCHIQMHLNIRKWTPCCSEQDSYSELRINPNDTNDFGEIDGLASDDDQPLAIIATKKLDIFQNFYRALTNFRNHFMEEHDRNSCQYSNFSDSSVSENENAGADDLNSFDDLTHNNMRKDKMDEETRLELSQVQTKINGKLYFTCRTCGKNLSSTHTYIYHKRIHTGERPCVCHICGKQFRAPNGLQRHLIETHEKQKRYICVMCAKNFANSQNLKQHIRIHTGERPFVCPQCGKRFTQSGSLHVHLKTHSELLPHQCAECGAQFRLRSGLARHRLKHSGERPHVCSHCGKAFRQKHELTGHALTHSDSKPHACALCGAAFRQRRALRHHCRRLHATATSPTLAAALAGPYH
ncbi:unnamed protein product [Euphydryas editha]|uniref:Uncharacterized protein n=1 Tax=Euphydryas editha TaxID=104508 RepID=A0AAU9U7U9_EUPED|nr:unnamed protein product [Euphydryas editha]